MEIISDILEHVATCGNVDALKDNSQIFFQMLSDYEG